MDLQDQTGSVAAAQYFFALLHYGTATGNLAAWDAMVHLDCAQCGRERQAMIDAHAAGQYDWNDREVRQVWVAPPEDGNFSVTLELEPTPLTEPAPPDAVPLLVMEFRLRWGDAGWQVHQVAYGGPEQVPEWPSDAPSPSPPPPSR